MLLIGANYDLVPKNISPPSVDPAVAMETFNLVLECFFLFFFKVEDPKGPRGQPDIFEPIEIFVLKRKDVWKSAAQPLPD